MTIQCSCYQISNTKKIGKRGISSMFCFKEPCGSFLTMFTKVSFT